MKTLWADLETFSSRDVKNGRINTRRTVMSCSLAMQSMTSPQRFGI